MLNASSNETIVRYTFEGAWLPEEGKLYIWYLEDNSFAGKTCYNPVNDSQGVFAISGSNIKRYEPSDTPQDSKIGNLNITQMKNDIKKEANNN